MDPNERLTNALTNIEDHGLSGLMVGLVGGTFMTVAYNFWELLSSLGSTIMRPFSAFGGALAQLVDGSIGGPVVMLEAAARTGVVSLTDGLFATFGIFAYPITMVAVMMGLWVFAEGWSRIDLSPWNFLKNLRS